MMNGRVYTLDCFVSSGFYPGFHRNCDCHLERVPDETAESDRDIFGSYLPAYLGRFGSLFSTTWAPYDVRGLDEVMRLTPPGGTMADFYAAKRAGQAGAAQWPPGGLLEKVISFFIFLKSPAWGEENPVLKGFQAVKIFESINGAMTSEWGLHLKPPPLRADTPDQSYYFPGQSVGPVY